MITPRGFKFTLDAGVGTITLSRPDRLNALTFEVYGELASTFRSLSASREARAVVLTGTPPAFCAGADLSGGGDTFGAPDASTKSSSIGRPASS